LQLSHSLLHIMVHPRSPSSPGKRIPEVVFRSRYALGSRGGSQVRGEWSDNAAQGVTGAHTLSILEYLWFQVPNSFEVHNVPFTAHSTPSHFHSSALLLM
jgi:hypothetical protein